MNIIITGATGAVGSEVLRQALLNKDIKKITLLTRSKIEIRDKKVNVVMHNNFLDYSNCKDLFKTHDSLIWCLGVSQSQVSKQIYEVITYQYTIACVNEIKKQNKNLNFIFISGEGADQTGKSNILFAKVKGKTENALKQSGLKDIYLIRPGGINPIHKNKNTAFTNKLILPFLPMLDYLFPKYFISSVTLAKTILHILKTKPKQQLWRNKDLKKLFSEIENQ